MGNRFNADLAALQDLLREVMSTWRYHRTGVRPIRDAKAFEDMLVSASFALAEARLNILAYQRETDRLQVDAQQQLDHSAAVLRETVSLFDRLLGAPAPPIVPSKILVFTGSYRPVPANDVPAPGGAA
tara:strand:+ start:1849 stop:2232 length:384 start_codon:yes stop_codon:yes gene_type:complete